MGALKKEASTSVGAFTGLLAITDDTKVAVYLKQIIYWQKKMNQSKKERGTWWYKNDSDWMYEIGIGVESIRRYRKKLVDLGVIEARRFLNPAKMHYRVDLDLVIKMTTIALSKRSLYYSDQNDHSKRLQYITQYNTQDITKEGASLTGILQGVPEMLKNPIEKIKNRGTKLKKNHIPKSIDQVLAEHGLNPDVKTHEEVLESYDGKKLYAGVLCSAWREFVTLHHNVMTPEINVMNKKKLLNTLKAYPEDQRIAMMGKAVRYWVQFTKHCKEAYGTFGHPDYPTIHCIHLNRQGLYTFMQLDVTEEGNDDLYDMVDDEDY